MITLSDHRTIAHFDLDSFYVSVERKHDHSLAEQTDCGWRAKRPRGDRVVQLRGQKVWREKCHAGEDSRAGFARS